MAEQSLTLSRIIKNAQKRIETDRENLIQIAKTGRFQGTVKEIMDYLDRHDRYFQDKNLPVVKAALESYLERLPVPALKLTMASLQEELETQIQEIEKVETKAPEILSQDDLDALLADTMGAAPPGTSAPSPEPEEEPTPNAAPEVSPPQAKPEAESVISQSDIDGLLDELNPAGDTESEAKPEASPTPPDAEKRAAESAAPLQDQSDIDALLAELSPQAEGESGGGSEALQEEIPEPSPAESAAEETPPPTAPEPAPVPEAGPEEDTPDAGGEDSVAAAEEKASEIPPEKEAFPQEKEGGAGEEPEDGAVSLPVEPDLAAGDVPLDLNVSPPEEPENLQDTIDAIVEAAKGQMESSLRSALSGENSLEPGTPERTSPAGSAELPGYFVTEEGEAEILDTFYRIYVCRNGGYETISETKDLEKAKGILVAAWMEYPLKEVALTKITKKRVEVIKEDVEKLPVHVEVKLEP